MLILVCIENGLYLCVGDNHLETLCHDIQQCKSYIF